MSGPTVSRRHRRRFRGRACGATRGAADDFVRSIARNAGATFGLARFSLTQLAARAAAAGTRQGRRVPATDAGAEAVAARAVFDCIGDLALAGAPLLGAYRSVRGGHKLNHAVLSALMADPSAWVLVEGPELRPEIRPESRQEAPRRAIRGHADLATGLVAPAYGPDVS